MRQHELMPKVSVILPVYNGSGTVGYAVRSILEQTFKDLELLVVNDGSTDDTRTVVDAFKDPRIHIVHLPQNIGRSEARNTGLAKARAPYIAMIDADDLAYPERIEQQFLFMEQHPDIGLCGAWAHVEDENGHRIEWRQPLTHERIRRSIVRSNAFIHCTVLVRKSVLEKLGGFDKQFEPAEDYDLYLRIASQYTVANLPCTLASYRAHSSFRYRVKEQWAKLPVRWNAIRKYGYPYFQIIYLLTPLVGLLVPMRFKVLLKTHSIPSSSDVC